MDVAVPALVLFLLALPGLALRQSYLRGSRNLPIPKRPFAENLAWGLVSAISLHTIGLWTVGLFGLGEVDFLAVTRLIANDFGHEHSSLPEVSHAVFDNADLVLLYFAALCGAAVILGRWSHKLVVLCRLSETWPFTLPDGWHKRLTSDRFVADGKLYEELFAEVTAVVEICGIAYLFKGLLLGPSEIQFDENGTPELFSLSFPARRTLCASGEDFEQIPSDVFVLRYAETKTLNVRFFAIDPDDVSEERADQEIAPRPPANQ